MKKALSRILAVLLPFIPLVPPAQPPRPPAQALNVFTLGDSNGTFPFSWPQQLRQALLGGQVFNISKSGRTVGFLNLGDSTLNSLLVIDENLKKAADFTKERPYDWIVLELGTNDAKAVFADRQQEVAGNLETLIGKIRHCAYPAISKARIVVISPPPYGAKAEVLEKYAGGGKRVETMSRSFAEVANRTGCSFVDGYHTPGLDINTMTPDGLHLDSTGSRLLIQPVLKLFRQ